MVINLDLQITGLFQFKTYYILYEFVIKIKILYGKQFEFQASHSAEYAILDHENIISNSFEYSKQCCINISNKKIVNVSKSIYDK